MNAPTLDRPAPTFRREAIAGAVAAIVVSLLMVVVVVAHGSGRDDGPAAAAAATASEAPRTEIPQDDAVTAAPVMPEATGPTSDAGALPVVLPAVPLDAQASTDDGVAAEVVSLDAIEGSGSGVGNIAGPALRATVRLTNGTAEPVALDFVSVNLTHGADQTPASPLEDPSAAPFTGRLDPGATAEGVYVFTVPEDDRALVTLSVGYRAGAPYLVFTGAAR